MSDYEVRFTIFKHIIRLQEKTNERLSDTEYSRQIGLTRQAFGSLMKGDTIRVENETIKKLLKFFGKHGIVLTPGDFYEISATASTTSAPAPD